MKFEILKAKKFLPIFQAIIKTFLKKATIFHHKLKDGKLGWISAQPFFHKVIQVFIIHSSKLYHLSKHPFIPFFSPMQEWLNLERDAPRFTFAKKMHQPLDFNFPPHHL
jgi:hypothetical protein